MVVASVLGSYPAHIQDQLTHPLTGVPSKTSHLPSIELIVNTAGELLRIEAEQKDRDMRFANRRVVHRNYEVQNITRNMLWQLADAFPGEPELLQDRTFDALDSASRKLVQYGKEAARRALEDPKSYAKSPVNLRRA